MPVYNGERTIRACLQSVLASRLPETTLEVICVDNASTDRTAEILRSFGSRIQLEATSVRGPGAARNAGLRKASGNYVAFTDADCAVAPDWLERLVEPLRTGTSCATGGKILARPQAASIERFGELVHDHQKAIEHDTPPAMIGMNMAARRSLMLDLGGFDERWRRTEDVEISYRMLKAGVALKYCPQAIVYHHNRDTLPTLFREGFLHGYYSPSLHRAYGDFIQTYRAYPANFPRVEAEHREVPDPRLKQWQVDFLWKLFRSGKRVGRLAGRAFPPVRLV